MLSKDAGGGGCGAAPPQPNWGAPPGPRRSGFTVWRAKQVDCHGGRRRAILEAEYGAVAAIRPEAEYIVEETRCVLRPFYLDFDRTNLDDRVRLLIGSEGIRGRIGCCGLFHEGETQAVRIGEAESLYNSTLEAGAAMRSSQSMSDSARPLLRSRRHAPGVLPVARTNVFVRWLWSTKPQATATSASGVLVLRSRSLAFSRRISTSH